MSRYEVDKFIRQIIMDQSVYSAYKENPQLFLKDRALADDERKAILELDFPTLYSLGVHPFLLNGFMGLMSKGDRGAVQSEFRETIAAYGYPDFST
jgi:hypothetical protein